MKLRQAKKIMKAGKLVSYRTAVAACKTLNKHNV